MMEYDLFISFMGESMGCTPITLAQNGVYTLCDACYPLADAIGVDGHEEVLTHIMKVLNDSNDLNNPEYCVTVFPITKGYFNGCHWEIKESVGDSVFDLIVNTFDSALIDKYVDESHKQSLIDDFPIASVCGVECIKVIDSLESFPDFSDEVQVLALRQILVICFG